LIPGQKVDSCCCVAPLRQTTDAPRLAYGHGFTSHDLVMMECAAL
jgi:hypothetical protein